MAEMPPNGKPSTIQDVRESGGASGAVPPTVLVLVSIGSVQLGAAFAKGFFASRRSVKLIPEAVAALNEYVHRKSLQAS